MCLTCKQMKQLFFLMLAAVFACPAGAQDRTGYDAASGATQTAPVQRAQTDASTAAMRESQRLQKALGLDAKQTKQVYKAVYNLLKSEMPQRSGFGGPGGPRGGMGLGGGMGPGGGMYGGGPGRGIPGGPGEGMQSDQPRMPREGAARGDEASRQKTLAKKFRKLFTPEQYAAWERLCAEWRPDAPEGRPAE